MTAVFVLNNLVLLTLETPGYLIVNLCSYGLVMSLSLLALRKVGKEKKMLIEIREDLSVEAEVIDKVYHDLKILLGNNCNKENLPLARELAKICSELGPIAAELNEKVEENQLPKPSPFKQGSLRSAFRIAS